MQARFDKHDPRLYSLERDLAHNFQPIMVEVVKRLDAKTWPYLHELAERENVTEEALAHAVECLCLFIKTQADLPEETMAQGLDRCGFLAVPAPARAILMATLGSIILGTHWAGVREATMSGEGPVLNYAGMADYGREFAVLHGMSPLRRRLYKLRRRIHLAVYGH